MTLQEAGLLALAAIVTCWGVGAYNRLVRLRIEVGSAFAALAAQLLQRDALLRRWADAMHAFLEHPLTPEADLQRACDSLRGAVERAKPRPHVAALIDDIRSSEAALATARADLAAELPVQAHHISAVGAGLGATVMQVDAELDASDTALDFPRRQFNTCVGGYNEALLQFPTVLVARVFGFRPAGPL